MLAPLVFLTTLCPVFFPSGNALELGFRSGGKVPERNSLLLHPLYPANTHAVSPFRLVSENLRGGDGLAGADGALAGGEAELLAADNLIGLLDDLLTLGQDELDVAGVGHVRVDLHKLLISDKKQNDVGQPVLWAKSISVRKKNKLAAGVRGRRKEYTYTTVGTVRPSSLLGGLVDLDVLDDEGTGVEALGIGVGLGVLQEAEDELGGLDGPASAGDAELLACLQEKENPSA